MGKFADAIVDKYGKGKDDAPEATPDADDGAGAKGKMLAAALKRGDGEAIEEAIRAICE
jgi:hypothetical protein